MTKQYLRVCKLVVGNGSKGLDLSQFRIRFQVSQADIQFPNRLTARVYNLAPKTCQTIKEEFKQVTIEAGYESNSSLIFSGEIRQVRIGRENPVDTYCDILASSALRAHRYAVVNKTLAAGHTFKDQFDEAFKAMQPYGVSLGHITDLGNIKLPRARVLFGMAREVLRSVAFATNSSWHIVNGKLNILKNNESLKGGAIVINADTGMIGMPVQTLGGIIVRTLLNPDVLPGKIVQINEGSIQQAAQGLGNADLPVDQLAAKIAADGFYKVIVAEHEGDTRGQAWYTDITCLAASGDGTVAEANLAARGINVNPEAQ